MIDSEPSRAPRRFTVVVLGFSAFEREALASALRLTARRDPAYHEVDSVALADFIVADADQADAVQAVIGAARAGDTVFVGSQAPPQAILGLPRPIAPPHIQRALDALAGARPALASEPVAAHDVDVLLADLGSTGAPRHTAGHSGGGGGRAVLVVDDSGIARKFLALRLARLGYAAHTARSVDEALDRLARQRFAIVFTDIVLGPPGSPDGLALAQHVHAGALAPVVVVSGHPSSGDRVRASLAGCDAIVGKPVAEAELLDALRRVDPAFAVSSPH